MTINLDTLRKTAEAATPGPWEAKPYKYGPLEDGRVRVTSPSDSGFYNLAEGVLQTDASHIATFDPHVVLALLSRLEQAEQAVQRVREALSEVQTRGEKIRARGNNGSIYQQERAARGEGYLEATRLAFRALDGDGRE